jgi:hypothetical protein
MEKTPPAAPFIATPFGRASLVAEAAVSADGRPGEELVVQRLDTADGPLVRVGYRRDGRVLRGPVSATPAALRALLDAAKVAGIGKVLLPEQK